MQHPTYVVTGPHVRGGICPARKTPVSAEVKSDRKVMKALLSNFYAPMLKRNYGVEVKPLEGVVYNESFMWKQTELWATSPFMLRSMKKITGLIDAGLNITAIIDHFDRAGNREIVRIESRNPYAYHILMSESARETQWISVGYAYNDDLGKDTDQYNMEINPDFFMHVTGDAKEGFGWECRPKEIIAFMCPDDFLEWLKSTYDVIGDCLNLEREDY